MNDSEDTSTAPAQAALGTQLAAQDGSSLEQRFRGCFGHLTEVGKLFAGEDASQFKSLIRRVDDSYFRLQIWGSDMSADSKDKVTFDDILKLTSGAIHGKIREILVRFERGFAAIEKQLDAIATVGVVSTVARNEEEPRISLQVLQTDVGAICELVQSLVELSSPIQMERALQNNDGPYKNLREHVIQSANAFQLERSFSHAELQIRKNPEDPIMKEDTKQKHAVRSADDSSSRNVFPFRRPKLQAGNKPEDQPKDPLIKDDTKQKHVIRQPETFLQPGMGKNPEDAYITSDTDPWARKYLLTLDSGVISSFSSLFILGALMKKVALLESPEHGLASFGLLSPLRPTPIRKNSNEERLKALPCYYFDFIAGSGLGGLIAIMLSRLRMTVEECIEQFEKLAGLLSRGRFILFSHKRTQRRLDDFIRDMVRRRHKDPAEDKLGVEEPFASSAHMCKTIVLAFKIPVEIPYLFRSYDHPASSDSEIADRPRNPGPASKLPIWQVARATTASATPIEIDDETFLDGVAVSPNPILDAFLEVEQMNRDSGSTIAFALSIGSTNGSEVQAGIRDTVWQAIIRDKQSGTFKVNWNHALSSNHAMNTHRAVNYLAAKRGFTYSRFDVGYIPRDDWGGDRWYSKVNIDLIREATERYLQTDSVDEKLERTAAILVENRQLRSQSPDWERFCKGDI